MRTGVILIGLVAAVTLGSAATAQASEGMPARLQGLFVHEECDAFSTDNLWVLTERFELLVEESYVILGLLLIQQLTPEGSHTGI
ncbi:MAG: hypothetical protein F4186_01760 [Boseongicola sp. SB0676_bin_33]|uniref:Uncharacterized protein n=1 Tax=Boseongicola sp. SB0664_bin_43 TaxID=2604844 RepID=A0A6B0XYL3_9RHOB|nr:hypothetical protein [Boseongicola sp. SB0664_bin_43]MYF88213.1 hypothetical protein [Boseongicola sp. SB0676_bin_33]MYK33328.1 hypothetical protein [Boseongicola sp. SB0670_bin_30]